MHPASSTLVGNLVNSHDIALDWGRGPSRFVVHGNSCPKMTVYVNPPSHNWNGGTNRGIVEIPFAWDPVMLRPCQWTTDHTVIVVDRDNHLAWNFWVLCNNNYTYPDSQGMKDVSGGLISNADGSWSCNTMQVVPTDGSYAGVGLWGGDPTGLSSTSSAAGSPFEAENVSIAELMYVMNGGSINHAIGAAVTQTGASVWPATSYDGTWASGSPGSVPEGTIFTWGPSAVKPSNMSVIGSAIYDAIGNYGYFIQDMTAGHGTAMGAENPSVWWNYGIPYGGFQPFMSNLLNWGTNEDGQGRPLLSTSWPWADMIAVTPRTASGIINNTSLPGAPTGLGIATGGSGSHQFTLTWTAPSSFGGGSAVGYYVFVGTSSGVYQPMGYNNGGTGAGTMVATTNSSTTTFTMTRDCFFNNLTSGDTYYFVVCALSSAGMGPMSSEVSAVAP